LLGTVSHDGVVLQAITVPRAPSPEGRCYLLSAWESYPCRQALPHLFRSYGLMRRTSILPQPWFYPCARNLCRLLRTPAAWRPFPTLSLRIFLSVLGPIPRLLSWCSCPFLPMRQRPSRKAESVGATVNLSTATPVEFGFSGLQSFDDLQARRFARHPGCSHREALASGSHGFYVPAYLGLLPPRAGDMLAVRSRATDGRGTYTLPDSQPCRLLPARLPNARIPCPRLIRPARLRAPKRRACGTPCRG